MDDTRVLKQTLSEMINGKTIRLFSDDFPNEWLIIVYDIPLEIYERSSFYRRVNYSLRHFLPAEKVQQSVWAMPK